MSDETDKELAFEELIRRVPHDDEPTLSVDDLEGILDNNKRAQRWVAGATLSVGSPLVMPTTRNGHVYRVIQGGILSSTEPTWPIGLEDTLVDGAVTLIEAGMDFSNIYDIRGAIQEALHMKSLKSIEHHEGDESKIHAQARDAAREWATPLIG